MFYEMKEKRRPRTASPATWWLTAALSAAAVAVAFAALVFWLGLAVRQPPEATSPADRYPGAPSPPTAGRHSQPYNAAEAAASTPRVEYPTAEILKTTIKNKKGRVEMVEATAAGVVGADKVVSVVDGLATAASAADTHRQRSTRPPPATATATAPEPTTIVRLGSPDAYAVDEKAWPDAQLRSKMAQLADAERRRLGDGVSPLDESPSAVAAVAETAAAGDSDDGHGSLVRKKSEATLPAWYDASLQQRPPPWLQRTETERGEWKGDGGSWGRDGVYELADFSRIEPDLSAFNSKTIPAFTYLKEPLPQRPATGTEAVLDADEAEAEAENDDDADDMSGDAAGSSDDASSYSYHQRRRQPLQSDNDPPGTRYHRKEEAAAAAAENALMSSLRKRLAAVQQWLLYGSGGGGDKNRTLELADLANAFNSSLLRTKSVASLLHKLKALYGNLMGGGSGGGGGGFGELRDTSLSKLLYPSSASALANTTSLVSFGLLAIDLFLLHNVQQIVWNEQSEVSEQMLRDPEVVALNALFMSPERVRRLQQRADSRVLGAASASVDDDDDDDRRRRGGGGVAHDLVEFVNGSLRAILNLSKAYKSSTAHRKSDARSASGGSTLDCIWTLYCRNLDKTAKLRGPYGFLAKMNGLGLRLMMGEFPVDRALDRLIKEYNGGWSPLDCEKLFPRCKADEAKEVVIETALRRSPA